MARRALTTQAVLAELDDRGIGFITLRARHPALTKALAALPASAGTSLTLGRTGNNARRVRVHDNPAATLSAYPRPIRQLAVTGLGHDQPTLLITNRRALPHGRSSSPTPGGTGVLRVHSGWRGWWWRT